MGLASRLLPPVAVAHHGVNVLAPEDNPMALVVSPDHLAAQVRALARVGYRFVTAEEVAATGCPQARGTAVLTFDDGWRDALGVVAPLLSSLGVRGTFYVNPAFWGGQHQVTPGEAGRLLSAAEARELVAAGMELGSHAMRHDDLRGLDDAALAADLRDSKAAVEDVTGAPCRTLAYPFGAHDARVRAAAQAAGYALAWAWLPGPWDPFAAPRVPGPTRHGGGRLLLKAAGLRGRQRVGAAPAPAPAATG